jgi:hypothetical protein
MPVSSYIPKPEPVVRPHVKLSPKNPDYGVLVRDAAGGFAVGYGDFANPCPAPDYAGGLKFSATASEIREFANELLKLVDA